MKIRNASVIQLGFMIVALWASSSGSVSVHISGPYDYAAQKYYEALQQSSYATQRYYYATQQCILSAINLASDNHPAQWQYNFQGMVNAGLIPYMESFGISLQMLINAAIGTRTNLLTIMGGQQPISASVSAILQMLDYLIQKAQQRSQSGLLPYLP